MFKEQVGQIMSDGMVRLKVTYQYVFIGVLLAMIGAFAIYPFAASIAPWVFYTLMGLELAIVIAFIFMRNAFMFFLFTLLTGITMVPMLSHYIAAGAGGAVLLALIGTVAITLGLTIYAATTKKSFLSLGSTLFWILIALLVMMVANLFIGSSIMATGISMVAVVLFSFFLIYDTQAVLYTDIDPLTAAMGIYLDILNLFVHLVHLLAGNKD